MRKDIITGHAKLSWILDQCQILHLGLTNQRGTYVVPVHYGYQEGPDGHYTIFIHGTGDGEKAAALDHATLIGFEADHGHENLIYTPPRPSDFSPSFMSVIGTGTPRRLTNPQEKLTAVRTLIHHYVNTIPVAIAADDVKNLAVWSITVTHITGRVHNPTAKWAHALGIPFKERYGKHYQDGAVIKDDSDHLAVDDQDVLDAATGASQKE